ncbi:MAG: ester cyclase [Pseudomonadota bacterium]
MSGADVELAKALVWAGAYAGPPLPDLFATDVEAHLFAPVGKVSGRAALWEAVFAPLARAFPDGAHRPYVFLGGTWQGAVWVAATGVIRGTQTQPLWGVPPGAGARCLRFGSFFRVAEGRVVETRMLVDLPGLAAQAGYALLPPFAGDAAPAPGPRHGSGLMRGPQDAGETAATLALVEDMLGGCNRLDGDDLGSMGMAAYWDPEMVWHGPWGIGSCHGFRAFQDHAQGPSVRSFPDRRGGFHQARIADGVAAAFTGWPSLQGRFTGAPFRGIAPTGGPIGQNIMDFYIRRGDLLYENWVMIDLVDFAAQCGVDLLEPLDAPPRERTTP